jgi:hypothetical protein
LNVDITEGKATLVPCRDARLVILYFLDHHRRSFRMARRVWGCYVSRKDGVGWQFHCGPDPRHGYFDIGAGRRW